MISFEDEDRSLRQDILTSAMRSGVDSGRWGIPRRMDISTLATMGRSHA